jgi:hypothetical protein
MGVPMLRLHPTAEWLQRYWVKPESILQNHCLADFRDDRYLWGTGRKPDARETT